MRQPPTESTAASTWPLIARFGAIEARLGARAQQYRASAFIYEFLRFGVKQAWACVFGGAMVALIVATHLYYPRDAAFARYDVLFVAALALQIALLGFRLETLDEAKVILVYHVIGTAMEVFKTDIGSWVYPEAALFRIGGVPLFSGFMYASIGSYIARCWRLFDFRFTRHPPMWALGLLAVAIYANFYTHHRFVDVRVALFAASMLLFGRCQVYYRIWHAHRHMPLLLGLVLVDRRKPRHLDAHVELSAPGARLVGGQARQARIVVPAADRQLCAGRRDQPASGGRVQARCVNKVAI
jgi:uncharacterized membrane protein YoaT (DUF817 family)